MKKTKIIAIIIVLCILIYHYCHPSFIKINSLSQIIIIISCSVLFVQFFKKFQSQRNVIPNVTIIQPIEFEPLMTIIERHIIRIPLEDRVDFNIEDNHNVHNLTIKRSASMAIESLKQSDRKMYSINDALVEINQLIKSSDNLSKNILNSAQQALIMIDNMNATYLTANISEKEVIRLVWERINHPINKQYIDQLKENLIREISDCKRGQSSVHCCEGRITRILQSLQNCDAELIVDLRPLWAFKEEIENKISKYRLKLFEKAPKKYAETESKLELNDFDRQLINEFNSCLLKNLSKRFEIDYIKPGYLTKTELEDLTKVYYNSLYDY